MRKRRQPLQVSTFPFLAVLLCTMGALLLLLLVIGCEVGDAVSTVTPKLRAARSHCTESPLSTIVPPRSATALKAPRAVESSTVGGWTMMTAPTAASNERVFTRSVCTPISDIHV